MFPARFARSGGAMAATMSRQYEASPGGDGAAPAQAHRASVEAPGLLDIRHAIKRQDGWADP